jgi:hypothetical protein
MHSKPSRAALAARTGACSGAALLLTASGLLLAPPAGADGIGPGEAQAASTPNAHPKKHAKKSVKHAHHSAKAESTGVQGAQGDSVDGDSTRAINGLVNVADLNVQLVGQICNNFVPVNVLGGQGAGESLTGSLALLGDATGTNTENLKGCKQAVQQGIADDADGDGDGSVNGLVNVTDNNVHIPLQGCNNFVPVNVLGGQGAGEQVNLSGALGLFDADPGAESTAKNSKNCAQASTQDDDDDDSNTNGLVNVTDNDIHAPVQACNNYVPVNVLGGQGSGEEVTGAGAFDLSGIFGDDDDDDATARSAATNSKGCDQDAGQGDH